MKLGWELFWTLALAVLLAPFARADVCQKGGAHVSRIKTVVQADGRLQFLWCEKAGQCRPLGPKDESYTREELERELDELEAAKAGARAGDAAGSVISIFFFATGFVPLVNKSVDGSERERQKALRLEAELKTLASEFLTSDDACHDVASLSRHRDNLAATLALVVEARPKPPEIEAEKLTDEADPKTAAPRQDLTGTPSPAPSNAARLNPAR